MESEEDQERIADLGMMGGREKREGEETKERMDADEVLILQKE